MTSKFLMMQVFGIITEGTFDKPVMSKHIQNELNISSVKVRECVRQIRRDYNFPIVGSISNSKNKEGGYYLVNSFSEFRKARENLQHRINSMQETLSVLDRKASLQFSGQMTLFQEKG